MKTILVSALLLLAMAVLGLSGPGCQNYEVPAPDGSIDNGPGEDGDGHHDTDLGPDNGPQPDGRDGGPRPDSGRDGGPRPDGGRDGGPRPDGGPQPDGGPWPDGGIDGGGGDGPLTCPTFIEALATCAFQFARPYYPPGCPVTHCLNTPCKTDSDCPISQATDLGPFCVIGDCVWCWQDSQCTQGQVCRSGRCVDLVVGCPTPPPCSNANCYLVSPSELPCPVCVCDSIFNLSCANDSDCLIIQHYPYRRCVYGRCADCRDNDDCQNTDCLPPGMCFPRTSPPEVLFGLWLIGYSGGLNHYSYFRIEPDGMLRRGSYISNTLFIDDMPPLPCQPQGGIPSPALGTWEIEQTQAIVLAVRASLNLSCDTGAGWTGRFTITISSSGTGASFYNIDTGVTLDGRKVAEDNCAADMSSCKTPSF